MKLDAAIRVIESAVGDPHNGLPPDVFLFVSRVTPLINVDLLIKDPHGRTLLTWRDDGFYGRGWHVPGGIIRYKETFADRIRACAREELGTDASSEPVPLAIMESIAPQASRGHAISMLFRCSLRGVPDAARRAGADAPSRGQWRWHDGPPSDLLEVHREYTPFL
jgi:ADP-ribose pyrophosphatase YjhB (NUDIX family)